MAFLTFPELTRLHAIGRLVTAGVDIVAVRKASTEHLGQSAPEGERIEWERFLDEAAAGNFVAGTAGDTSEFCGVGGTRSIADDLGVGGMANRFAELIALRETRLPLAIGLFGNWGSGKSHFMNLIDRRLKSLTKSEEKRSEGGCTRWCREIVPVYFNAWHYLDTNLWASLVSQIFESLFAHLRGKTDALEGVQMLLRKAQGAPLAVEELELASGDRERKT